MFGSNTNRLNREVFNAFTLESKRLFLNDDAYKSKLTVFKIGSITFEPLFV